MTAINRRRALSGTAAIAVGVPVLAACGSDDSASDSTSSATDGSTPSPSTADPGADDSSTPSAEALATTSDVPVGSCFVVSGAKVVLTQPSDGDFKAFSAVCTHQGCLVETSSDGDIPCPCHGSRFSLEDGSPVSGPATSALEAVEITVDGDSISLA